MDNSLEPLPPMAADPFVVGLSAKRGEPDLPCPRGRTCQVLEKCQCFPQMCAAKHAFGLVVLSEPARTDKNRYQAMTGETSMREAENCENCDRRVFADLILRYGWFNVSNVWAFQTFQRFNFGSNYKQFS